jgi:MFS transporter, Spinster family, sphingosine-1-phosphate transporter
MSQRGPWGVVALLTAMNLFNYLDRFILPPVLTSVKNELALTRTQAGFLQTAFILVFLVAAPVFGRLGDVGSRTRIIALGVFVWSLATASGAIVVGFATLLLARSFVGIGEAAYATIAPSMISDLFPPEKRGRIMSLFFLAIPLGSAAGFLAGGMLGQAYGWRSAFLITGLPGLLLAALALRMHEPPRGAFDSGMPAHPPPLRDVLPTLARNFEYRWTVIGYTAQTFAIGGLAFWMPDYLQTTRGMKEGPAGLMFGTCTVIGGIVGTVVGGWIGEKLRGRVRHPYLVLSGVTSFLCGPIAVAAFGTTDLVTMQILLILAMTLLFCSMGPINTVLVNCVAPGIRATAQAVCIFLIHVLGDALSPTLIGAVADASDLARAVFLVPLALCLAGVAWLYGAWRYDPTTR